MVDVLTAEFGGLLRTWRNRRGRSQLALASEAGVSQRHISFLETGRSNPSREMVVHLSIVLDLPLRDRNRLLMAAGFAPIYRERQFEDPELADVRHAVGLMLQAHEPFPAYVVNRRWDLLLANDAATRLLALLPPRVQELAGNMLHLSLHPDGLRTVSRNWEAAAAVMLRRLTREVAAAPDDLELADLLAEIRSYPDMPSERRLRDFPAEHDLLVPVELAIGDTHMSLFTTIATLGPAGDITLEELRLETLLPATRETEMMLRALSDA